MTDGRRRVTVPRHDHVKKGTLLAIITQAGLTREEFLKLLKEVTNSSAELGER